MSGDDLRRPTRFAVLASIGVLAVVLLAAIATDLRLRSDLIVPRTQAEVDAIRTTDQLSGRLGLVVAVSHLLHGALFGWFLWTAHRWVARRRHIEGTRMALWSFFVPFANFVAPYRAAKRVLDATHAPSPVTLAWWLVYLGAAFGSVLAGRRYDSAADAGDLDGARQALLLSSAASVALLVALGLAVVVVERIDAALRSMPAPRTAPRPVETTPVP